MAKSKQQKQEEALIRKREAYIKLYANEFGQLMPGGAKCNIQNPNSYRYTVTSFVEAMQRRAKEVGVLISGRVGWCSSWSWPTEKMIEFYFTNDNLKQELVRISEDVANCDSYIENRYVFDEERFNKDYEKVKEILLAK